MQYLGGKFKLSKYILPIILENRKPGQWYVEPFVGGANSFFRVDNPKLGNDNHYYLIEMLKAVQSGWNPPEIVSKEFFQEVKSSIELYDPKLVGFIGFCCSFGGIWFRGYASDKVGRRNYARCGANALRKIRPNIEGAVLKHGSYLDLDIPENSLIYCDPPYARTTKFTTGKFDHDEFWQWCRMKSEEGHDVFISEYNAPPDFGCVYEKEFKTNLYPGKKGLKRVEKLFTYVF